MANNTTYGINRIQDANLTASQNYNGTTLQTFQDSLGSFFLESMAGSYEIAGVLVLASMGFGLFKQDVSTDVTASILVPLTIVMGTGGFLPGGEGLLFGMLVGISTISIFGVFKFIAR
jgi:hypothetical protein